MRYVSSSLKANSTTADAITIDKPSGVVSGVLLVAFVRGDGSSDAWTLPTDWTEDGLFASGALTVASKIAGGSEPADYTFTAQAASASFLSGVILALFRPTASPFDVSAESVSGLDPAPTVTTTANYDAVLRCGSGRGSGITWLPTPIDTFWPPGTTGLVATGAGGGAAGSTCVGVAIDTPLAAAGAQGTEQFTPLATGGFTSVTIAYKSQSAGRTVIVAN